MANDHQSVLVNESILERLNTESRRLGMTRSDLAMTLLEEGLRMLTHPGIVFRPGPVGRRPALAAGPDIWEFASVAQAVEGSVDDTVDRIAELTFLTPREVSIALRYYHEYRDEIDEWIRRNDEEAEQARAAWLHGRALLKA